MQNGGNENEVNSRFHIFVDELSNFSANEQRIFSAYRVLSRVRVDVCSKNRAIDLTVFDLFERITTLIDTEIITILKLKNPGLIKLDRSVSENEPELLNWTEDKNDLIALIYAIAKSIDNDKAKIKKINRCFEYIFQIDPGNVYDALGILIYGRKALLPT